MHHAHVHNARPNCAVSLTAGATVMPTDLIVTKPATTAISPISKIKPFLPIVAGLGVAVAVVAMVVKKKKDEKVQKSLADFGGKETEPKTKPKAKKGKDPATTKFPYTSFSGNTYQMQINNIRKHKGWTVGEFIEELGGGAFTTLVVWDEDRGEWRRIKSRRSRRKFSIKELDEAMPEIKEKLVGWVDPEKPEAFKEAFKEETKVQLGDEEWTLTQREPPATINRKLAPYAGRKSPVKGVCKPAYHEKCSHCGKLMNEGYLIEGGLAYFCSEKCMSHYLTQDQFEKMYGDGEGETFWTGWEDKDDWNYDAYGNKVEGEICEPDTRSFPDVDLKQLQEGISAVGGIKCKDEVVRQIEEMVSENGKLEMRVDGHKVQKNPDGTYWVYELPYMTDQRKFNSLKEALEYVERKKEGMLAHEEPEPQPAPSVRVITPHEVSVQRDRTKVEIIGTMVKQGETYYIVHQLPNDHKVPKTEASKFLHYHMSNYKQPGIGEEEYLSTRPVLPPLAKIKEVRRWAIVRPQNRDLHGDEIGLALIDWMGDICISFIDKEMQTVYPKPIMDEYEMKAKEIAGPIYIGEGEPLTTIEMSMDEFGRPVYMLEHEGRISKYTKDEMGEAFNALLYMAAQKDWKAPIDIVIRKGVFEEELIKDAIYYFTATEATISDAPDPGGPKIRIKAIGYRKGPAGDK